MGTTTLMTRARTAAKHYNSVCSSVLYKYVHVYVYTYVYVYVYVSV